MVQTIRSSLNGSASLISKRQRTRGKRTRQKLRVRLLDSRAMLHPPTMATYHQSMPIWRFAVGGECRRRQEGPVRLAPAPACLVACPTASAWRAGAERP